MNVRKTVISSLTAAMFLSAFASESIIINGTDIFRTQNDTIAADASESPLAGGTSDSPEDTESAPEAGNATENAAAENVSTTPEGDAKPDSVAPRQSGRLTNRTIVNIKSRKVNPIHIGDSTVYAYVGNVVAYHNGALMLCDSAVRYDENRIECFDNVLINKDSTYVYGDRILYNRLTNTAQVFAPLIKMIDGSAVLYTYNFQYNTLDNVGKYHGGGTLSQDGMLLESDRGYYYGNTRDAVCVGRVELRDSTYLIRSDSLGFNMDSEIATFYRKTYIWNDKDEILSADSGWYDTRTEHYNFTADAYVLSEDHEVWADDMDYRAEHDNVIMRRNIQIIDHEQEVIAFGDYGQYWGERGDAMLTDNPSVISYQQSDSVYMRADSIFMYVIDSTSVYSANYVGAQKLMEQLESSVNSDNEENTTAVGESGDEDVDVVGEAVESDETDDGNAELTDGESEDGESLMPEVADAVEETDSPDTEFTASDPNSENVISDDITEEDTAAETTEIEDTKVQSVKELKRAEREARRETKRRADEERRAAKRLEREERQATALSKREERRQSETDVDSLVADTLADAAELIVENITPADLTSDGTDNFTPETDESQDVSDAATADNSSISDANEPASEPNSNIQNDDEEEPERVIVAYRRVKIYRSDLQAICDSLVSFSRDTTVHMFKSPVMWNGANQIKSDSVTVYIRNENLDNAVFYGGADHGNPIMSAELDPKHYNQITGKSIQALFRDNEIYRTNVIGNGQTYYYMQDEETHAFQGFLVMECSDISFLIDGQEIEEIIFRGNPSYSIYPMNMIPESQPQQFQNFVWEGELRPYKSQVFNRTIRPSQRETYTKLPQPVFPITQRITSYRNQLTSSGRWRDRDDDVTYDALDFMHRMQAQGL